MSECRRTNKHRSQPFHSPRRGSSPATGKLSMGSCVTFDRFRFNCWAECGSFFLFDPKTALMRPIFVPGSSAMALFFLSVRWHWAFTKQQVLACQGKKQDGGWYRTHNPPCIMSSPYTKLFDHLNSLILFQNDLIYRNAKLGGMSDLTLHPSEIPALPNPGPMFQVSNQSLFKTSQETEQDWKIGEIIE